MPSPGKNAALYWGAYKLSDYLNKISPDRAAHLEDVTTFDSAGTKRLATNTDAKLDVAGFFQALALDNGSDNIIDPSIGGAPAVVSYCPQGVGSIGNFGQVYLLKNGLYKQEAPSLTGVITIAAGGQGDDSGYTGRVLHIDQVETGALNGVGVDLGVSHVSGLSPRGYVQTLHVLEFEGTNAAIKTQWSADNFSTAGIDIGVPFTTVTGLTSEYQSGTTTSIGRYVRYVLTGTFVSIRFVVLFAKR